jgi:hypothetical protein
VRFPFRLAWNSTASYVGLLAASFGLALFVSYIFGPQINDYAYDSMFRAYCRGRVLSGRAEERVRGVRPGSGGN